MSRPFLCPNYSTVKLKIQYAFSNNRFSICILLCCDDQSTINTVFPSNAKPYCHHYPTIPLKRLFYPHKNNGSFHFQFFTVFSFPNLCDRILRCLFQTFFFSCAAHFKFQNHCVILSRILWFKHLY